MLFDKESKTTIETMDIGKCYQIYNSPQDRLKQGIVPRFYRMFSRFGLPNKIKIPQYYKEFWALRNVSLTVDKGEVVGVIGRNGSGKSTLLQMIAGTLSPTEGIVNVKAKVAALLELGSGFNPQFTGNENIYLNGAIYGLSHKEISQKYDEILKFADIGDFIDQPVKTYSSGMFARLAFAVAVAIEPEVLIVDEILAVGDIAFQRKCYNRMDEMIKKGVAILLASHSIEVIRQKCTRCIYLSNGRIKAMGDVGKVCDIYIEDTLEEKTQRRDILPLDTINHSILHKELGGIEKILEHCQSDSLRNVSGNLKMKLIEINLFNDTNAGKPIIVGQIIRIEIDVIALLNVENFLFGFLIRNKVGTHIFGRSISSEHLGFKNGLNAEDVGRITVRVKCDFEPEDYFISYGLQGTNFTDVYYYVHDATRFHIFRAADENSEMITGIARVASDITAYERNI